MRGVGRVWLCPLAFALMLTGCAGEMGPIRTELSPPPVMSFDGSYRTVIRSTGSASVAKAADWCQTPSQSIVTVTNGQLNVAVPHPNLRAIHRRIIGQLWPRMALFLIKAPAETSLDE